MRMGKIVTDRPAAPAHRQYTDVLVAALAGDGEALDDLVGAMDDRTRARLLNACTAVQEAAARSTFTTRGGGWHAS